MKERVGAVRSTEMFVDARTVPDGSLIEADVCLVGAGAAGITIALELRAWSLRTALHESGWLTPDPATPALYVGKVLGRPYFPLESARTRHFGGTTPMRFTTALLLGSARSTGRTLRRQPMSPPI